MNLLTLLQSGLHNDEPIIRQRKFLHFIVQHRLSLFWSLCAQKNLKNADNFSDWKRENMILFDTKFDYKIRPLWKWDHTLPKLNVIHYEKFLERVWVSMSPDHQLNTWILKLSYQSNWVWVQNDGNARRNEHKKKRKENNYDNFSFLVLHKPLSDAFSVCRPRVVTQLKAGKDQYNQWHI